jgi:hypothetical protein
MAVELFRSKAFIEGMEAAGSAAKPSVRCRVLFEAADKKVLGCSFDQDGCPVCRTLCSLWKRRQRDAKYQLLQDKGRGYLSVLCRGSSGILEILLLQLAAFFSSD